MKKANILGTEYAIEIRKISEDEIMRKHNFDAYCLYDEKLIVLSDTSDKEYFSFTNKEAEQSYNNTNLRHELIHAFLYESGLSSCCEWASEEMVDWLAIQFPKLYKVFEKLDCEWTVENNKNKSLFKTKSTF